MATKKNQIIEIPISQITVNPDNENIFNMHNIDGLVDSIASVGFTGHIQVIPKGKDSYEVISGHRRFEAAKLAGLKKIPSIVMPVNNDVEKAKLLIVSNIYNRELSPMDKARAIEYYIDNVIRVEQPGANIQTEVANVFKISTTQVKYLRRILTFIPELQGLLEEGLLPYSGLVKANQLDPIEQKELYELYISAIKSNNNEPLGKKETTLYCEQLVKRKELATTLQQEKIASDTRKHENDLNSSVETSSPLTKQSRVEFEEALEEYDEDISSSFEEDNGNSDIVELKPAATTIDTFSKSRGFSIISGELLRLKNSINDYSLSDEEKAEIKTDITNLLKLL